MRPLWYTYRTICATRWDIPALRHLRAGSASLHGMFTANHIDMVHLRGIVAGRHTTQVLSALRAGTATL
jgi:hypothetical protein